MQELGFFSPFHYIQISSATHSPVQWVLGILSPGVNHFLYILLVLLSHYFHCLQVTQTFSHTGPYELITMNVPTLTSDFWSEITLPKVIFAQKSLYQKCSVGRSRFSTWRTNPHLNEVWKGPAVSWCKIHLPDQRFDNCIAVNVPELEFRMFGWLFWRNKFRKDDSFHTFSVFVTLDFYHLVSGLYWKVQVS